MPTPRCAFAAAVLAAPLVVAAAPPVRIHPGPGPVAVAPDGRTVIATLRRSPLRISRLRDGVWSEPSSLPWSEAFEQGDPCFSADGQRLYFWANRNSPRDIWVSERQGESWAPPRPLGLKVDGRPGGTIFPSLAPDGTLYFTHRRGGQSRLYRARPSGSGLAAPEPLGPPLDTGTEFDGAISPDGKALLFCRSRAGAAGSDLMLSRLEPGGWSEPRRIGGDVATGLGVFAPRWSRDGAWVYFTASGGGGREPGLYRIPAAVLAGAGGRAEPIAPGRLSSPGAFGLDIAPDGVTACFAETHGYLTESRLEDGAWSEPVLLPCAREGFNLAPCLGPDGTVLALVSNRSAPGHPQRSEADAALWLARRVRGGWTAPIRLGNLMDESAVCFLESPSLAADGALYFVGTRLEPYQAPRLFVARPAAGGYGPAEPVQGLGDLGEAAISPDGNRLVLTSSRPGGLGGSDLYLAVRGPDGAWSAPRNLGPGVNGPGDEAHPSFAADGRTLHFFSTREGRPGTYRVDLGQ